MKKEWKVEGNMIYVLAENGYNEVWAQFQTQRPHVNPDKHAKEAARALNTHADFLALMCLVEDAMYADEIIESAKVSLRNHCRVLREKIAE